MSDGYATVVVYCDGPKKEKGRHKAEPLAVYRRKNDDWLPIHSVKFRANEVIIPETGIQHLVGDEPQLPEAFENTTQLIDARQRGADRAAALGGAQRSQYQWKCQTCGENPAVNDPVTVETLFNEWTSNGATELSLSVIDELVRKGAQRRR